MFHIAQNDRFCPPEAQSKIRATLAQVPQVQVYTYEGVDHAFAREGGENYAPDAAKLANARTTDFFQKNLG